jgi:hypothetical protein
MSTIDAEHVSGIPFVSLSDRLRIKCIETEVYFVNRTKHTMEGTNEFKTRQFNPEDTAFNIERSNFTINVFDNDYYLNTLFLSSYVNRSIVIDENFTLPLNKSGDTNIRQSLRNYKDSIDYRTLKIDFDDDNKIIGFDNLPTLDGVSVHHYIVRTTITDKFESYGISRPIHLTTYQCSNACVS